MKKNFFKKILKYSGVFLAFALPLFIFAQGTQVAGVITDINWAPPTPVLQGGTMTFSMMIRGSMTIDNPNSVPYGFQLERGIPETFLTNPPAPGGTSPEQVAYGPVLSSDGGYINANTNQFAIPALRLWPSTRYYFDMLETTAVPSNPGTPPSALEPLHFYDFRTTSAPNANELVLSRTTYSLANSGSTVLSGRFFPSIPGSISGMPISLYVSTTFLPIDQEIDPLNPNIIGAVTIPVDGNDSFVFNLNNLAYDQTYYVKLVNDKSDLDINNFELNFSAQGDPNPADTGGGNNGNGNGNGNGNSGGIITTPPTIGTDENFSSGLVNCDGVAVPCTFEKLLLMVNKVINFFIYVICIPIITLTFAYAGLLMVTSGGNPAKKDDAKSIIGKAVTGFVLLLAAWLIIKTVLVVFGYQGPLIGLLGIQ